jgi:hypothetical protein
MVSAALGCAGYFAISLASEHFAKDLVAHPPPLDFVYRRAMRLNSAATEMSLGIVLLLLATGR